ncbi:MAG: ROK family protein [Aureispira sp.]
MQTTKIAIGIDIGGTNIVWGIVNEQGTVLQKGNWSTSHYPQAEGFVQQAAQTIHELLLANSNYELAGIGIGAPNGNYFNGTIEFAPNLVWKGIVPLKALFQQYFEVPVWVTNDANAAAIGEQQFGAAKGQDNFVIVTLGTGVGSGFVVNGALVYGHDGFAGELGHTIVERQGRNCGCGRLGCLETYASATGIVRTAVERLAAYKGKSLLQEEKAITAKSIAVCATQGDALALEIFDFTAQQLGFSLANMVAITSPALIVLFGGLANAGELILSPTKRYMEDNLLNIFQNKIPIVRSTIPENDAAILGSAALVWKNK